MTEQEEQNIIIHNIYNPARRSESDSTVLVDVRTRLHDNHSSEQILLGDFNLHHPMWGGTDVRHIDPESADLPIKSFSLPTLGSVAQGARPA